MTTNCLQIAARNQRESPLLRLPAELRNEIYVYVLHSGYYHMSNIRCQRKPTQPPKALALLCTSRQIHAEAILLPISQGTLAFNSLNDVQLLRHWPRKQKAAITSIELVTYGAVAWAKNFTGQESGQVVVNRIIMKSDLGLPVLETLDGLKTVTLVVLSLRKGMPQYESEEVQDKCVIKLAIWIKRSVRGGNVKVLIRRY
ncbi:hypothetical protein CC80DRAFT_326837 [Byssothecium circinans]|uniref:F-box domain-containing protein n=1 Tax=Byssothecium circinans TaxID=147558 RepID=A0A6A5U620_9PLEO|nr:hypothetical protein CC80DRAFT_326837 [Byssothecium circinans]